MCLKKTNLSILHWVCLPLSKSFKKDEVKNIAKSESDFYYDSKHTFFEFYKGYDELEELSLDSKYKKMKKSNKIFIIFKGIKPGKPNTT